MKPWIKWALAATIVGGTAVVIVRRSQGAPRLPSSSPGLPGLPSVTTTLPGGGGGGGGRSGSGSDPAVAAGQQHMNEIMHMIDGSTAVVEMYQTARGCRSTGRLAVDGQSGRCSEAAGEALNAIFWSAGKGYLSFDDYTGLASTHAQLMRSRTLRSALERVVPLVLAEGAPS